jgi:hypothetical protein
MAEIIVDIQYLPWEKDAAEVGGAVKREVESHVGRLAQIEPWFAERPPAS